MKVKRVNPKSSHHKEKKVFLFLQFVQTFNFYLYQMMDVHYIYYGNHFMMYVSQIIMLYTLNLYRAVCQLYLNKTVRKKRKTTDKRTSFIIGLRL